MAPIQSDSNTPPSPTSPAPLTPPESLDSYAGPITDPVGTIKKHLNRNAGGTIGLILALVVLAYPYVKPKLDKLDTIDAKVQNHDQIITQNIPAINTHVANMDAHLNNTDTRLNEMSSTINAIGQRIGVQNRHVLSDEPTTLGMTPRK